MKPACGPQFIPVVAQLSRLPLPSTPCLHIPCLNPPCLKAQLTFLLLQEAFPGANTVTPSGLSKPFPESLAVLELTAIHWAPWLCVQVPISPFCLRTPGGGDGCHLTFCPVSSPPPSPTWCLYTVGARSTLVGLKRAPSAIPLEAGAEEVSGLPPG